MEQFNDFEGLGIYVKTHDTTFKYTFMWMIENYSEIRPKAEESPQFSVEPQSVWCVEHKNRKDCFMFRINRDCDIIPVTISCKLTVNDRMGKEYYMEECNLPVCSERYSIDLARVGDHNWPDIMNVISTAENDTLIFTLLIEVRHARMTEVVPRFEIEKDTSDKEFEQKLLQTVSVDLKKILDSPTKPDFVLRVQEQKIKVHRAILSARSAVFDKLLPKKGMSEAEPNVVDIVDVTMPVLKELVAFLYSGQLKEYDFQTAMELYYAAAKYEVLELREVCARALVSKMTLVNAPKILRLAEMHRDTDLKDKVMQFIKIN